MDLMQNELKDEDSAARIMNAFFSVLNILNLYIQRDHETLDKQSTVTPAGLLQPKKKSGIRIKYLDSSFPTEFSYANRNE